MVVFYERQFIMKEYFRILKQKVKDFWRNLRVREQWAYITALSRKIYAKAYNKINVAGTYLGQIGISANAVSWSGFVIGVFAVNFIAMEMYGWALLAILLNRFCDGLDGAIARSTKVTDFGVFLDATLDYIFYGGVIFAFALADPAENGLAAACMLWPALMLARAGWGEWRGGYARKARNRVSTP